MFTRQASKSILNVIIFYFCTYLAHGQICTNDSTALIQKCGEGRRKAEKIYLDFFTGNSQQDCECALIPLFSGSVIINIISIPDVESYFIITEQQNGSRKSESVDFRNSPLTKTVKDRKPLILKPYNRIRGQNYFCLHVEGKNFEVSCGSGAHLSNTDSIDKVRTNQRPVFPDRKWKTMALVVGVTLLGLCLVTIITILQICKRVKFDTKPIDSGGDAERKLELEHSIFYVALNSPETLSNIQNKYEALSLIRSCHIYKDLIPKEGTLSNHNVKSIYENVSQHRVG